MVGTAAKPDSASVPDFVGRWVNLAQPRLRAHVLAASDDFFAPKERLIQPEPPVFVPGKYDDRGKWMDGWESRRRRTPGHDWCIVRFGSPGIVKGVDIDTSHFTGNYPPEASLEARYGEDDEDTAWVEIVPRTALQGDSHHYVAVTDDRPWTHLRLNIFPDGGVARLRVYGRIRRDWSAVAADAVIDLAALENGGRAIACNDRHFGAPENMLAPGRATDMGDGWETRRRRAPGHDWAIIALGHAGFVRRVELDTSFFKGNYPDRASVDGIDLGEGDEAGLARADAAAWQPLLPAQKLEADRLHVFQDEVAPIGRLTHVRLNIYPDGGVARLRLFGTLAGEGGRP